MNSLTPTQPHADACTRKPSRLTAAPVSPEVAKLMHKLQGQIIKEASARDPAPGEVVLQAVGKTSVDFFNVDGTVVIEIQDERGAKVALYREYQPSKGERSSIKPGRWWGSEYRIDTAGKKWSHTLGQFVCNDYGDLVEVAR